MKQEAIDKLNREVEQLKQNKDFGRALVDHIISLTEEGLDERILLEKKKIEKCCNYVIDYAKGKKAGNCTVLSDDEVYGKALEYYKSDDPKLDEEVKANVNIVRKETEVKVKQPSISKHVNVSEEKPSKPKVAKPKKQSKNDPDIYQVSIFDMLSEKDEENSNKEEEANNDITSIEEEEQSEDILQEEVKETEESEDTEEGEV